MNKFSRNEWLGASIGFALGFVLCLVGVCFWPPSIEEKLQHHATKSPDGSGEYQEVPKSIGETFAGIIERTFDDPIALYTFVLVIFTGLLGFATVRLWFVTKQLVDGAEDTAERQLRAYIGIVGGSIAMTRQYKISIELQAVNQGRTPAHEVEHFICAEIRALTDEKPGEPESNLDQKWVMTPGALWTLQYPPRSRPLPDGSVVVYPEWDRTGVMAVESGDCELIIWGKITYRDVFYPATPVRETSFCYRRGTPQALRAGDDKGGAATIARRWDPESCIIGNVST